MAILSQKRDQLAEHALDYRDRIKDTLNRYKKKAFYTYSLNIDKKDYDRLEKGARKEGYRSISKFIKEKY
ncbi:MAG: hypothetical protein MJ201_01390 [Mycoplasmoidaceae bacterium]|nr:hypothetical protein [Mycoplasmoidaceae bacterium]